MKKILYKISHKIIKILPKSYKLPFYYYAEMLFGEMEPELRYLKKITKGGDVALDIGANHGLYSFPLSKIFKKVYAFELNKNVTESLQRYNSSKIDIINVGLSDCRNDNAILYIPLHKKGFLLYGWASLNKGNCPDSTSHEDLIVKLNTLDSFSLDNISFIKIDVEGHELNVLNGAINTIKKSRPVVLVEVKIHNKELVSKYFEEMNYKNVSLFDLAGYKGGIENYIFFPN